MRMEVFMRILLGVTVLIMASASAMAQTANIDARMQEACKRASGRDDAYVGSWFLVVASNLDSIVEFAKSRELPEACAQIGTLDRSLNLLLDDLENNYRDSAANRVWNGSNQNVRAFALPSFCGIEFTGNNNVKKGDYQGLYREVEYIGSKVIESAALYCQR